MGLHYLLLGLALSLLPFQTGAVRGTTAGAARSDAPKAVSAEPAVQEAVDLLLTPATTRLDVFVVIYERLVPVTPETIETHHDYRITIPGPFPSPLQTDLVHALETCAIERVNEKPRYCNWAVVGYGGEGKRVFTMYLGGYGQALINGTPVLMGDEVREVLYRRCAPLWQ
jgi:hypothetical protein